MTQYIEEDPELAVEVLWAMLQSWPERSTPRSKQIWFLNEVENILEQQSFVSGYLEQQLFVWLREQEQLRTEAPPESAEITEEQRKRLNSIGYVDLPANR